jgi:hypothetical protein
MKDDRYTVDSPPEEGTWVYKSSPTFHLHLHHRSGLPDWALQFDLENGTVHRTRESAEAHAVRMYMVDEILGALETFVNLEMSVDAIDMPDNARLNAVLEAQMIIAKARGEVEE